MAGTHRQFKDSLYDQFARIGKAVAAPKRLELLDLLAQAPRTVEALAELAEISVANASQHLQRLRAAQLVVSEKRGLYVEYRLADASVGGFVHALRAVAEARLVELGRVTEQYLHARDAMEAVDGEALLRRVRAGEVTVIDVRPREEFSAGHIPGALSVPIAELERRLAELPADREVVAYCRGPCCVFAIDAVQLLRRRGYRASRMEAGVVEWRARGWSIEHEEVRA